MTLEQLRAFFGDGFTVEGSEDSTDGRFYAFGVRNNATGEAISFGAFTESQFEILQDSWEGQ